MWLILLYVVTMLHVALFALLTFAWNRKKEKAHSQNPRNEFGPQPSALSTVHLSLSTFNSPPDSYRDSTLHTNHRPDHQNPEGISVLIAAKNEAENLRRFLPSVLNQAYKGSFEVIVALDRCTDNSKSIVAEQQTRHPHLKSIVIDSLPDGWTGKKYALQQAIQSAGYDCLAFTDADCELLPLWLEGMAREFAKGNDLVLGVSPYAPAKGFLNLLIRFETWMTAILYIGLAKLGLPYMAVGRSLGYRKSWFEAVGGFKDIAHRLSGDDDLLVNRHANPRKTGLLFALESQVISLPKTTWRGWIRQKIRHGSAGTAYKPSSMLILSVIHGLHLIFYLSLIVVLCVQPAFGWALMIYLLRTAAMIAILATLPWRNKVALLVAFPLLDVAYLIYLALLAPAAALIQPKWN
jgi:biofilm PGA synthesis N-glycosyltransferase PgaC